LDIEYKGTAYCGWQRQKNGVSVQELIENALEKVLSKKTVILGSGRTDAGVHALGQVAHFNAETHISPRGIMCGVNSLLPTDISIKKCTVVDNAFHAQSSAKSKVYAYKFYISDTICPLKEDFAVRVKPPLNIDLMREASAFLLGTHDFKAFSSTGMKPISTIREVLSLEINQNQEDIEIKIEGNGFLYNMVRIIAGTLIEIGKGFKPVSTVSEMLRTNNRRLGGKTSPPKGLVLIGVYY